MPCDPLIETAYERAYARDQSGGISLGLCRQSVRYSLRACQKLPPTNKAKPGPREGENRRPWEPRSHAN